MENQIERLKIQKDILWGLYQEHRTHARHSETLRAAVTNMLIAASAVLISIVIIDKLITQEDLGAAILLVGFGLLGIAFNLYYTSKIFKHKKRARKYFEEFSQNLFFQQDERNPNTIINEANQLYEKSLNAKLWNNVFLIRTIKTISDSFVLWSILPLFISLIGSYLVMIII